MMMTMEEKGISYHKNLLDEQKMPDWYACSSLIGLPSVVLCARNSLARLLAMLHRIKDVCDGNKQIPFMKENETGKWLYDSDKMAPYLEDKYPDLNKIAKPDECPQV